MTAIKQHKRWDWPYWGIMILFFLLLLFLLPTKTHGDRWYWLHWASYCFDFKLGTIYQYKIDGHVPTNYHPFFLHCLNIFQSFFDSTAAIKTNIFRIKIFPLIFDFIGAFSIFLLVKKDERSRWLPLFLLFNIAYLYNSIIWGQIDSIFTNFALLAMIFALRQQPGHAMVFYLLSLNTKLQSIIFFPILGLLLLPSIFNKWKQTIAGLIIAGLLQIVLTWPFIQAANLSEMIATLTTGSVDLYARTSLMACNFWFLFFRYNTVAVADTELFWGVNYKTWGLILFCLVSALTLIPVALRCMHLWRKQLTFDDRSKELVFLAMTLVAIAFFFFNTQMHERYSHPALILSFFYGYYRKNYLLYLLISIGYFLNLELSMKAFDWNYKTWYFEPVNIALLFATCLLIGLISFYRRLSIR